MNWRVQLHPDVDNDLKQLGTAEARRALKAIREKLADVLQAGRWGRTSR